MTTKKAAIEIINKGVRKEIEVEIDAFDLDKIFSEISNACKMHLEEGSILESIYFYEEESF